MMGSRSADRLMAVKDDLAMSGNESPGCGDVQDGAQ
jgi:hypothetical protein